MNDTNESVEEQKLPKVHMLSSEFMLGRLMQVNLVNIGLEAKFTEALQNLGYSLTQIYEQEAEQGLGMAGLGVTTVSTLEQKANLN